MAASYHSPCWLIISCVAVVIRDHCETSQRGWQTDKHFPHLKTTNNIHHISWKSKFWSKYELLKFYSRPNEISREKRSNFPLRSNKTIWPNLTIVKMWTLGLSRGRNISRLYHLDGLAMILFQEGTPKVKRRMEHNFFFRGRNFHWNWIIFHHVKRQSVKNPMNQINWPSVNFILQKTSEILKCTWTCMVDIRHRCTLVMLVVLFCILSGWFSGLFR